MTLAMQRFVCLICLLVSYSVHVSFYLIVLIGPMSFYYVPCNLFAAAAFSPFLSPYLSHSPACVISVLFAHDGISYLLTSFHLSFFLS